MWDVDHTGDGDLSSVGDRPGDTPIMYLVTLLLAVVSNPQVSTCV